MRAATIGLLGLGCLGGIIGTGILGPYRGAFANYYHLTQTEIGRGIALSGIIFGGHGTASTGHQASNTIKSCRFDFCMTELADGGSIYVSGTTMPNSEISGCHIDNMQKSSFSTFAPKRAVAGIYTDNVSGVNVRQNTVWEGHPCYWLHPAQDAEPAAVALPFREFKP